MGKQKEEKLNSSEETGQVVDVQISPEALKKIKDQAEKDAFERVCKAAGTTPKEISTLEANKKSNEDLISYDVTPTVVHINGQAQPSRGIAPRGVVEVILAAAGAMRNRRLEELIGKDYELRQLRDGTLQARLVNAQDAAGMQVNV